MLTGVAVDIGGSAVIGFVLAAIYALQLESQGVSEADMREAMSHIPPDSAVAVAGTLLGALVSVFAGYVCARIVRRGEYRCGCVMTAIVAVYGLVIGLLAKWRGNIRAGVLAHAAWDLVAGLALA